MTPKNFEERLTAYSGAMAPIVPIEEDARLLLMDFTRENRSLTPDILEDTTKFTAYIEGQLSAANARYGIGGYNEHRTIYSRSEVFDSAEGEPRRLHLGIDIWGEAGTPVYAPVAGSVHSTGYNDAFGDYGATLILHHDLQGLQFYTLYGHLSLASIQEKKEGEEFAAGDWIASFGEPAENGNWPPHLHFQVILKMDGWKGDYPGVCRFSEKDAYLSNCPNPDILLGLMKRAR